MLSRGTLFVAVSVLQCVSVRVLQYVVARLTLEALPSRGAGSILDGQEKKAGKEFRK